MQFNYLATFTSIGSLGVVWFLFWVLLVFNSPEEHPRISSRELKYIRQQTAQSVSKVEKVFKISQNFLT